MLHWESLSYLPEIIRTEVISGHHDNPLAAHFGIDKTRELVSRKYYWPTLRADVEALYQGLQRVSSIQGCPPQALRRPAVTTSAYALMEGFIIRFCHRLTSLHKLEGRNLRLHPCHRQPAYKDGILRASQGHHQYSQPRKSRYQCVSPPPRPARLNRQRSRPSFHLEVLVFIMLLPGN